MVKMIMLASEAAKLPDIVGRLIDVEGVIGRVLVCQPNDPEPLRILKSDMSVLFVDSNQEIEVLG